MARARRDAEWDQTAMVLAMIANGNRGRRTRPFSPKDFHPATARRRGRGGGSRTPITAANIEDLKTFLPASKRRGRTAGRSGLTVVKRKGKP